jgi:hypothetical protein
MKRAGTTFLAAVLAFTTWSTSAQAYRPFDGTDADVAERGEYELELGPAGYVGEGGSHTAVAPWMIHNLGIADGHELVLEGRHFVRIGDGDVPRNRVTDTGLFLKSILRRGSLQGEHGPSVATEIGPLLPEFHDDPRLGASAGTIFSQRFRDLALHLNVVNALARTRRYDLFLGLIVEGPARWAVRPVAEVFLQRTFSETPFTAGLTRSALVGAIAPLGDAFTLDGGVRVARGPEGDAFEIRAGVTWAVRVFGSEP